MKSRRPLCFARLVERWVGMLRNQKDSVGQGNKTVDGVSEDVATNNFFTNICRYIED